MAEIIMAFAPLVFLIVYALKTRKMADAMILATLLAMVLPTAVGMAVCMLIHGAFGLLG